LALPSLWVGLQLDDFTIRAAVQERELAEGVSGSRWEPFTFLDGDPRRTRKAMDLGLLPWWTDPECRLAFWRPLTAVTHILDYRVWPDWPWLMHLQSLLWFALLLWATSVLYRRLIGRTHAAWIAALAALLFALDDAHAFPAGWLANRNSLLAGLFGVLALVAHDRWRRDGWRAGALGAPLALLAGLLAKEATVSAGGYLLAYALFLDPAGWRSRWASLLPYLVIGAAWFAGLPSIDGSASEWWAPVSTSIRPTIRSASRTTRSAAVRSCCWANGAFRSRTLPCFGRRGRCSLTGSVPCSS
jgi:hypothetical protein